MNEQLKLDLGKIDSNEDCVNLDDGKDDDNGVDILYKSRLKKLVKQISESEEFNGIQLSKQGIERFEEVTQYLVSILIFDILNQLNETGRKKITPNDVDKSVDRILEKSSAIDTALELLQEDIRKLTEINKTTSINKAIMFINQ